jgi:hypothetical protein
MILIIEYNSYGGFKGHLTKHMHRSGDSEFRMFSSVTSSPPGDVSRWAFGKALPMPDHQPRSKRENLMSRIAKLCYAVALSVAVVGCVNTAANLQRETARYIGGNVSPEQVTISDIDRGITDVNGKLRHPPGTMIAVLMTWYAVSTAPRSRPNRVAGVFSPSPHTT